MEAGGSRILRSVVWCVLVAGLWAGVGTAGAEPASGTARSDSASASAAGPAGADSSAAVAGARTKGKPPLTSVLGITVGAKAEEVHRRLGKLGERQERERKGEEEERGRELWTLRHPRFRYVVVGFDEEHRVKSVQGYMRPEGPRMRYAEIGPLSSARRLGYYIYEWETPATANRPALLIQARGNDPLFLGNYLVMKNPRVEVGQALEEKR